MYNLNSFKQKLGNIETWLSNEYKSWRTGRATPAVLDGVNVELYGAQSKISHLAAISVEDAKTIRIAPWDKAAVKAIESALSAANLGVSVVVDGAGMRVIFPDLTAERRKLLEKLVKEKHEEARVSIKRDRESVWNDIVENERKGTISEDEKFKLKEDMQTLVDTCNKNLELVTDKKITEISQ